MQNVPRLSAAGTDGRSDRTGVRDASVIDFSQARTGHLRADNLLRPVPTTPRSTNRPPPKNGRRFNHQGPIIGGSDGRVKRRLDGNGLIIALFAGLSSGPQRQVGRSRAEGTVVASAVAVAMTSARRRSAAPHADRLLRRDATVCIGSILLKNCSRLGQRGVAGGHKPSPERVAFNSGRSMRSNFAAVPAPLRQTSFSTE